MTPPVSAPADCRPTPSETLLLRAALLRSEEGLKSWEKWQMGARRPLRAAAARLLPAVYLNLRGLAAQEPWLETAKTEYLRARYSNLLRFDDAAPVLRALSARGLDFLLLKGAALILGHYGDLDILVREERAEQAIEVLGAFGYAPAAPADAPARALVHSVPLTKIGAPPLDLHWRPFELDDARSVWEDVEEARLLDLPVRLPAPAGLLLHACVSGSCWDWDAQPRWILDALAVIRSSGSRLDWGRFSSRVVELGLSPGVCDSLRFLRKEFGATIPAEVLEELAAAPTSVWERRAARARSVRPDLRGPILTFALRLDEHRRLVRRGVASGGLLGLMHVWRRSWGLEHLWLLPVHAALRGGRRAWQLARHRLGA
mgnify:CR=1 FL=1